MANALNGHFEMPQTFPAVSIDVTATNMWQLEGCDKVDAQVAHPHWNGGAISRPSYCAR